MNLIAEFCQNHNGKPELVQEMLAAAKRAGVQIVKLQGIYVDDLVFREDFESNPRVRMLSTVRPFEAERDRLSGLELSMEAERDFVDNARALGLLPMTTVFSHRGLLRALELGFRNFKIASYDCGSLPLIDAVAMHADTLVISTGATPWSQVRRTIDFVKTHHSSLKVSFLHAVTEYPSDPETLRMGRMLSLKGLASSVGFSDHSHGLMASKVAMALGAESIERHFTVLPKNETKDGPVSVNEEEMRELVEFSKLDPSEQFREVAPWVTKHFATLRTLNSDLEPTQKELVNANYYRGRFASTSWFSESTRIPNWDDWR